MSLDPLLEDKLRTIESRYEDLNLQMADPEVASDTKRYQKIAKAHSDYGEIVSKYREYREIRQSFVDTQSMLKEPNIDPEMKAMTEEEL
ncbi:MAG TPA: PCRF domain-containing protein, partial [Terriglobia bacterium]|nr:PCRF domain-containing protein [Terriglobia bacterium]